MKANTWSFRAVILIIAFVIAGELWLFFNEQLHPLFFVLLFFWIMHIIDIRSRLKEINDRLKLQQDLIGSILVEDEDYVSSYHALLEDHGFHAEAAELDKGNDHDAYLSGT